LRLPHILRAQRYAAFLQGLFEAGMGAVCCSWLQQDFGGKDLISGDRRKILFRKYPSGICTHKTGGEGSTGPDFWVANT